MRKTKTNSTPKTTIFDKIYSSDSNLLPPNIGNYINVNVKDILPGDIIIGCPFYNPVCLGYSSEYTKEERNAAFRRVVDQFDFSRYFDISYEVFLDPFFECFDSRKKSILSWQKNDPGYNNFKSDYVSLGLSFSTALGIPQDFLEPIEYVNRYPKQSDNTDGTRGVMSVHTVEHGRLFLNRLKHPYFSVIRNY